MIRIILSLTSWVHADGASLAKRSQRMPAYFSQACWNALSFRSQLADVKFIAVPLVVTGD
jgi:hypothetical protein